MYISNQLVTRVGRDGDSYLRLDPSFWYRQQSDGAFAPVNKMWNDILEAEYKLQQKADFENDRYA